MDIAEVSYSGDKQTVNIPAQYHIASNQVYVNKVGDVIMLIPTNKARESFLSSFNMFSDDFMEDGRPGETESVRESL